MQPLRLLVAVAAIGLAAFTDEGKHFTIDFPPGWNAPVTEADGNVQSNTADTTSGAFCRANSTPLATLNVTQAVINATYGKPLDKATWAGVFSIDAAETEISEGQAQLVDGHVVQIVTMTLTAKVLGEPMKARFASHILPGRMVNVGCFARAQSYDGMKATFESAVRSLKPL
jgi:hypothetical protein